MSVWMVPLWIGLLTAAWTDISYRRIPNVLTVTLALTGLGIAALGLGPVDVWTSCLAMITAFAIMAGPFALRIYKGGDLKLVVAAAAWLHPLEAVWAVGLGVVLGGVFGLMQTFSRPGRLRALWTEMWLIILSAKIKAPDTEDSKSTVPMGVPFGMGVCAVATGVVPWL